MFQHFEHVPSTDGFPSKPAPEHLFTALVALGAQPARKIVVVRERGLPTDIEAGGRARVELCTAG
jgi:phosphoglycolate phosphatase